MLALLAVLAVPVSSDAEDAESLRRELDAIRRNFETLTREYERKIEELSERVRALESPAPPATTTTAPPPITTTAPPAAAETSLADILAPRQPFALGQSGRALLFDIGVSGDFVADFTSDRHERRHDGTFAGRENRLFPREVSVGFFGRVDPYAAAVVRITAGEEAGAPGESVRELTVNLEEANVTLFTLPLGTTARFGLMRPRFGTLNAVHEDDLPQVDRPDVLRRFFGEEQLNSERGWTHSGFCPRRSSRKSPSASSTATTRLRSVGAACAIPSCSGVCERSSRATSGAVCRSTSREGPDRRPTTDATPWPGSGSSTNGRHSAVIHSPW